MKRFIKWLAILLGFLVGLILVAGAVMVLIGNARLNKVYDFPPSNLTIPTDEASIAYGRHRVETLCADCHAADLGGVTGWFNVGPLGTIDSANLTAGEGGTGREFTSDEDYVRVLRHGIDPRGKPIYMPAVPATSRLSDEDLGAIIAYLKTVPPVDRKTNGHQFSPVAKILFVVGMLPGLPVEMVSHETSVSAPEAGVSVQYGEYLVGINDCQICHGKNLAGGEHPDPGIKARVPNLTPGGEVGFWTEEQFMDAIREGQTPGGHQLDPKLMPWKTYRNLGDEELQAIWLYLQSLPKLPTNP